MSRKQPEQQPRCARQTMGCPGCLVSADAFVWAAREVSACCPGRSSRGLQAETPNQAPARPEATFRHSVVIHRVTLLAIECSGWLIDAIGVISAIPSVSRDQ